MIAARSPGSARPTAHGVRGEVASRKPSRETPARKVAAVGIATLRAYARFMGALPVLRRPRAADRVRAQAHRPEHASQPARGETGVRVQQTATRAATAARARAERALERERAYRHP